MAHPLTVYHHTESFFRGDEEFALDSFPRAVVVAEDDDRLRDVLERALSEIHDEEVVEDLGLAAWLSFADPEQPSALKVWRASHEYWGVTDDGRLFIDGWALTDLTVGDLRRGSESGYFDGAWDHIVILDPEGLGGPHDLVSPFTEFLNDVGVELAVGAVLAPIYAAARRVRRSQQDRRARRVVAAWHRHGIDGPWLLSRWIDVKTAWKAEEVATRLGMSGREAESLLRAMGYEPSERLGLWTVGTTEKAIKRRRRWDRGTTKEWQRPRRQ